MKNGSYHLMIAPDMYPGFKYRGRYAYVHHIVWWNFTGECVNTDVFVLHHINENRCDNRYHNLLKLSRKAHTSNHHPKPKMITLVCDWCGCELERELRVHKSRIKNRYEHSFCSRSHQVRFQRFAEGQI